MSRQVPHWDRKSCIICRSCSSRPAGPAFGKQAVEWQQDRGNFPQSQQPLTIVMCHSNCEPQIWPSLTLLPTLSQKDDLPSAVAYDHDVSKVDLWSP